MPAFSDALSKQRDLECCSGGGEVGAFTEAAFEGLFGLATSFGSLFEIDIGGISAISAITTTLSGRTWRNPPAIAKASTSEPFRMRSSPTPSIDTSGAWWGRTPSSPSMPGSVTASTSSL